jgi:hypothetical protein
MTGKYEDIGAEIGRLVDKKQKAYGRSFEHVGQILRIIFSSGIRPDQYDDLGAMIRIIDKLFRIATSKKAFGEDPWEDVAGYALLMNRDLLEGETGRERVSPDTASFFAPFRR